MRNTKRSGDLAQVMFLYRAMRLGLVVSELYGDNGARFLRMQVKSNWAKAVRGRYGVNVGRDTAKGVVAYTKAEIDGFAVYLDGEERWYLMPVEGVRGRKGLKIFAGDRGKAGEFGKYLEDWKMLRR